jgi:two-component system chemotaxis sensor kinase CheA
MSVNFNESEYFDLFNEEASIQLEELNRYMTALEKQPDDTKVINALFRITHTLKGNASGLGLAPVAELSHVLEDLFAELREGKFEKDEDFFSSLFRAIDVLEKLIKNVKSGKKVSYKGIRTKLQVMVHRARVDNKEENTTNNSPKPSAARKPLPEKLRGNPDNENFKSTQETHLLTSTSSENVTEQSEPPLRSEDIQIEEAKEVTEEQASNEVSMPEAVDTYLPEPVTEESAEIEEVVTETSESISFSESIQVPVKKLDNLLNLVGELVIEKDRILTMAQGNHISNEFKRLQRISSDLQYSMMDVRLVEVGFLFNKFHRVVRDAAKSDGKSVRLLLEGSKTELDRNILQTISDSLIHLTRNAIAHGIETPELRKQQGKPEEGTITLRAFSESDSVTIEIEDDGAGINAAAISKKAVQKGLVSEKEAALLTEDELIMFIFQPGFSSVEQVNGLSGRGVGMDVVKEAMDAVGGSVAVKTETGKGTTVILTMPSSMAVKSTLLFELNTVEYAIPLNYTEAVTTIVTEDIHKVSAGLITNFQGQTISIVFLNDIFGKQGQPSKRLLHNTFDQLEPGHKLNAIIVNYNQRMVGLVVDRLLQQKEIVEKPLLKPVDKTPFISGVTILGNGNVCLVLSVPSIFNYVFHMKNASAGKVVAA